MADRQRLQRFSRFEISLKGYVADDNRLFRPFFAEKLTETSRYGIFGNNRPTQTILITAENFRGFLLKL
ncbi:MAG TPA: hypothetical protein PKD64_02725 [Pirellulaceae bacterium]|nr:hypothetical protein [Pirellulaceae bacterium]HMO91084.1 hypothetical protein [Pirellulaceae bacterium]HMP71183.1 hypothetical protein [Pirellulaceae bacterium]